MLHLFQKALGRLGRLLVRQQPDPVEEGREITRHGRAIIRGRKRQLHGPTGLSSARRGPILSARRAAAAAAAAVAFLVAVAPAATAAPLSVRLERALASPGVSWSATGVLALDLASGGLVYGRNADLPLRPASNEKLVVALTALDELGPNARIPTEALGEGRREGSVWRGRLVLKGYGDPTLGHDDLGLLARRLAASGITRVTGGIVADESYFDARRTAPGWKPRYYKNECPPLSALVVARARVGGRIASEPALAAAQAFRRALLAAGVGVGRGTAKATARASAVELAEVTSPRIALIVREMTRESDNFYAEMLLKEIGASELGRGTTHAGAAVVRGELDERGVPLAGLRIGDGSGLSLHNRTTARALVALLISAWSDPKISRPFFNALPTAGVSGTLRHRMTRGPAYGRVRAKTGTTAAASALSGFVGTKYVFAVVQNGNPIPYWHARRGQDRFAQVLAGS
jgi:D-alanyl-D-alanine carboxypeptidase/D-alanyl-D-alanine-endopeptidase (penicillin-binding protein 4)